MRYLNNNKNLKLEFINYLNSIDEDSYILKEGILDFFSEKIKKIKDSLKKIPLNILNFLWGIIKNFNIKKISFFQGLFSFFKKNYKKLFATGVIVISLTSIVSICAHEQKQIEKDAFSSMSKDEIAKLGKDEVNWEVKDYSETSHNLSIHELIKKAESKDNMFVLNYSQIQDIETLCNKAKIDSNVYVFTDTTSPDDDSMTVCIPDDKNKKMKILLESKLETTEYYNLDKETQININKIYKEYEKATDKKIKTSILHKGEKISVVFDYLTKDPNNPDPVSITTFGYVSVEDNYKSIYVNLDAIKNTTNQNEEMKLIWSEKALILNTIAHEFTHIRDHRSGDVTSSHFVTDFLESIINYKIIGKSNTIDQIYNIVKNDDHLKQNIKSKDDLLILMNILKQKNLVKFDINKDKSKTNFKFNEENIQNHISSHETNHLNYHIADSENNSLIVGFSKQVSYNLKNKSIIYKFLKKDINEEEFLNDYFDHEIVNNFLNIHFAHNLDSKTSPENFHDLIKKIVSKYCDISHLNDNQKNNLYKHLEDEYLYLVRPFSFVIHSKEKAVRNLPYKSKFTYNDFESIRKKMIELISQDINLQRNVQERLLRKYIELLIV